MSSGQGNEIARVGLTGGKDAPDEQMEQIRDLLLGDTKARLGRIEARLDAIEARIAALAGEVDSDRRSTFDQLAQSVETLSKDIRRIGKP
jgi:recombinational DNA repair ATPase RecF